MGLNDFTAEQGERLIRAVKDLGKVLERAADALEKIEARTPDPFDGIELEDVEPGTDWRPPTEPDTPEPPRLPGAAEPGL